MNLLHSLLITALGAGLLLSTSGCTKTSCSRDPDFVDVPFSAAKRVGNTYRSAPVGGPYDYFPPARTISFEHGLGETPSQVQFWLAFSAYGSIAPSAGNMTEIPADAGVEPSQDGNRIAVLNNTCSDFYILVVASVPAAPLPSNGVAGAGAADDGSAAAAGAAGASP